MIKRSAKNKNDIVYGARKWLERNSDKNGVGPFNSNTAKVKNRNVNSNMVSIKDKNDKTNLSNIKSKNAKVKKKKE